jgi:hypothetical protein
MGEIADMMLDGFIDEETGEIIDCEAPGYPRRTIDRKQEREFRTSAPAKDIPCVFQGCKHKFRHSTQYTHFVAHYEQHHRKAK